MPLPHPLPFPSLAHLVEAAVRPVLLRLESTVQQRHSWGNGRGQGFCRGGRGEADYHYLELTRSSGLAPLVIGIHVHSRPEGYVLRADVVERESGRKHFEHPRQIQLPASSDDFEVASEARTLAISLSDWVLNSSSLL
jgi:hypothetical protein